MEIRNPTVDDIYLAALERESADDRSAFLEEACTGNPELRRRVERLLEAQAKIGSFLEAPAPEIGPTFSPPMTEGPGAVIGPYKLLEQIGEGGFGVVFMAEQQQPVRRKVALKVLKPGMDTRQVIGRFEAERQALALMDHPSIAKVHDAGTTDSGRPYFVMELVKGISITEYCDQEQLTTRQRLELFAPVCQAVQHAHQKGIIHRDIKPSNVLVTLLDGVPVPKVIDFGVAKATGEPLTDKSLYTGFAQMIGTPMYMSPEQANLSGHDVDTRSDIYSLGVLLYELLTGTTPFDNARFKEVGYDEMRRIIREEEPPKPSTRLSTLGQAATTLSVQRKSDPRKLSQLFRGELDWIVMKCLEKDRNRRYETANSLARDIERYLDDEPVQACPPSAWYRFRKYARRNKGILAIASVVAVAVLAGIAGLLVSNVLIGQARQDAVTALDKAKAKRDLALHVVEKLWVDVIEQWLRDGPGLEQTQRGFAQEVLAFYEQLAQEETDNPAAQAEVGKAHCRMAIIHDRLGDWHRSEASYIQAADVFGRLADQDSGNAEYRYWQAQAMTEHAEFFDRIGRWNEAEALAEQGHALFEKAATEFPADIRLHAGLANSCLIYGTVNCLPGPRLGLIYMPETDYVPKRGMKERIRLLRRALELYGPVIANHPPTSEHRLRYYRAQKILSQMPYQSWAEREKRTRESLAGFEELMQQFPREYRPRKELCEALTWWCYAQQVVGRPTEAEAAVRRAVDIADQLVSNYPEVPYYRRLQAGTRARLAEHLEYTDRLDDAERLLVQAAAAGETVPDGAVSPNELWYDAGRVHRALGRIHERAGRMVKAEDAYRQAMTFALRVARGAPNSQTFGFVTEDCHNLAGVRLLAGRAEDAVQAYRDVVAEWSQFPDTNSADPMAGRCRAFALNDLAVFLLRLGRFDEADQAYAEAQAIHAKLEENLPFDAGFWNGWVFVQWNRACLRLLKDQPQDAIEAVRQRVKWLKRHVAAAPPGSIQGRQAILQAQHELGRFLDRIGRPLESMLALRDAIEEFNRLARDMPAEPLYESSGHISLAHLLQRAGKADEAIQVIDEAVAMRRAAAESGKPTDLQACAVTLQAQGLVRWRSGRPDGVSALDEAAAVLRKSLAERPDSSGMLSLLAQVASTRGRLLEHAGRLGEADTAYREAVDLRRRPVVELSENIYSITNNINTMFAPARNLADLARFHLRHGEAEQAAARCAEALDAYENTVASFPGNADALIPFAWFLVNCPVESQRDPARAVRLCAKATGLLNHKGDVAVAGTLGAAQYRTGDYQAAVASLDRATLLSGGLPATGFLFFRAMARWKLGEKDAARKDYDEAVRLLIWHDEQWSLFEQCPQEAAAVLGVPLEKTKE